MTETNENPLADSSESVAGGDMAASEPIETNEAPAPVAESPAQPSAPHAAEPPTPVAQEAPATPAEPPPATAPVAQEAPAEPPPATAPVAQEAPAEPPPATAPPAPVAQEAPAEPPPATAPPTPVADEAPAPVADDTTAPAAPQTPAGLADAADPSDSDPEDSDPADSDTDDSGQAEAPPIDPAEGLGLPEAGALLGPPNMGGFESGEIVSGTALTVTNREAEIDLGNGKIGVVGDRHWASGEQVDLTSVLKPGDSIEAAVLARADIKKRITLSRLWAQQKRGWEAAEASAKGKGELEATVTETVKGGLSLDVNGIRAFMPASLVDVQTVHDLKPFIGQTFMVRVIEADRTKARLIVSRKAAVRASQRQQAKAALGGIKVGQLLSGVVAQITDFGAFVDVEGVRGLVHKSEIGWSRTRDPQNELTVGQKVDVKVLKVQPSRNRLGLTMRTEKDPLAQVRKGERFEATVTRLVDFGAFVELPSGLEGLVHVSEMAEYRVFAPEEIVIPGEKVWVKVLKVDRKRRTIDLSMAQAVVPDPASEIAAATAAAERNKGNDDNAEDVDDGDDTDDSEEE